MGDISIIARRLPDGHVQYGCSGNGGYFKNVGSRLLRWYNNPDKIEYLFSLGGLSILGAPGSENGGYGLFETNRRTGTPHDLGTTERDIFSKIAFIDYGYFYDLDQTWYYVIPGPFRIKLPLQLVKNHLDENDYEFEYLIEIQRNLITYIFQDYLAEVPELQEILKQNSYNADEILKELLCKDYPIYAFYEKYKNLFCYFDDWVLVSTNKECTEITGFKMQKKTETHIETIEW